MSIRKASPLLLTILIINSFCLLSIESKGNHHSKNLKLTFDEKTDSDVFAHDKIVVCYVGTWAIYRQNDGKFDISDIDSDLCTHLIYSFAGLDNDTHAIKPLDPYLDLEDNYGKGWFVKFNGLKKKSPNLKVLLAIGGWNEGSEKYSFMASDSHRREAFINSAVEMIRKYGFDGLDLDWEFPSTRGGKPHDKKYFTLLAKELSGRFKRYGLILSAALGAAIKTAEDAYEIAELSKYLDHMHLMAYDYHGTWDRKSGHNAPLFDPKSDLSIHSSVDYYLKSGADSSKLILGLPTYGRTFLLAENRLKEGNFNGFGEVAQDVGFKGENTKENGFLAYYEICKEVLNEDSEEEEWSIFWDSSSRVPFMRKGEKWVSFDNPASIQEKVQFAASMNLGGAMIWSMETDDFRGLCGGQKYPLLRAINHALSKSKYDHIDNTIDVDSNDIPKSVGSSISKNLSSKFSILTVFVIFVKLIKIR